MQPSQRLWPSSILHLCKRQRDPGPAPGFSCNPRVSTACRWFDSVPGHHFQFHELKRVPGIPADHPGPSMADPRTIGNWVDGDPAVRRRGWRSGNLIHLPVTAGPQTPSLVDDLQWPALIQCAKRATDRERRRQEILERDRPQVCPISTVSSKRSRISVAGGARAQGPKTRGRAVQGSRARAPVWRK